MGLTNKKEEHLKKMPLIEAKISKSKNGKYLIYRTIITTIRPVKYFEAILANNTVVEEEDVVEDKNGEFLVQEGRELLTEY